MSAEKLTTVCGSTIFVKVKMLREKKPKGKRAEKKNPTPEKVAEINQRNSERDLAMILNYNFAPGDLHLCLTYRDYVTKEEAKKHLENFIRTCRRECRKQGFEFKAVHTAEYEHSKLHHHVVVNISNIELVAKLWQHGFVKAAVLDESGDYRKLAAYLIKETSKTFRDAEAFSKRRFNCTRSIERPVTKREEVSVSQLLDDPKPIKDYFVDSDSIYRGMNPFDERPYLEYVLIANDASAPRLTTWKRGTPVKYKERTYSKWIRENSDRQLEIEL